MSVLRTRAIFLASFTVLVLFLSACSGTGERNLRLRDLPTWPASAEVYDRYVTKYLAQRGIRGKQAGDWFQMDTLSKLIRERLQFEQGSPRSEIEGLIGPPHISLPGDVIGTLDDVPRSEFFDLPANGYNYPGAEVDWQVIGRNRTMAEWKAASYRDLERGRALYTMWPAGLHPDEAQTSAVYLIREYLVDPFPDGSLAIVVMYDSSDRMIGSYEMWVVDRAVSWLKRGRSTLP